uniref:Toxin CqTX-A n=1 Tax=Chiropsoides quadrigatus TaxID=130731 RepID=JTX1A_CHIQU|nr:RecName: Full=Toxin CqTX-A; Short=CQT-A; Short=Toxin A; Flags: Precursor [Chiropsoides quadrigatus]BAB82520.1 CqTX-A [Chiropsoides quadrigatus]
MANMLYFSLLALLFMTGIASEGTISSGLASLKAKIDAKRPSGKQLFDKVANMQKQIEEKFSNDDERAKVMGAIGSLSTAVGKFQSGDPAKIASGCLDILVGISSVLKDFAKFSPIFSILSMVVGLFSGTKAEESVGSVVKKVVQEQSDQELQEALYGVKREYAVSKAFLDGVRNETSDLSPTEVSALGANVPVYQGVRFIAMVVQRIKNRKPRTESEIKRVLSMLELFTDLCSLRDLILLDLYQLVATPGHSPNIASGIKEVSNLGREEYKKVFEDLLKTNDKETYLFLSYLYPRERNEQSQKIFKFFDLMKVKYDDRLKQDLTGIQVFSSLHWPNYFLCSSKDYLALICTKPYGSLRLDKLNDGFYSIKTTQSNPKVCHRYGEYILFTHDRNDDLEKFNFVPVKLGERKIYLLSSKASPNKFAYVPKTAKGDLFFVDGIPSQLGYGNQGYFTLATDENEQT